MAQIVLVRHAMPVMEPEVPPDRWRLGDEGRAAARELAHALPRAPFAVTSDEPKARESAEELVAVCGGTLTVDARVAETRRPRGWDANFAESARQLVAGRRHDGWESQHAVVARFDSAVREAVEARAGAPLVVVTHGQALTLWLQSIGAVDDAPRFWSELAFPDAWIVTLERARSALVAATLARTRLEPDDEIE
jgi:broad specificity phosphatase PhoE